jgi:hypothetical protein
VERRTKCLSFAIIVEEKDVTNLETTVGIAVEMVSTENKSHVISTKDIDLMLEALQSANKMLNVIALRLMDIENRGVQVPTKEIIVPE